MRLGNGDGTVQAATIYTVPGSMLMPLGVGDFNRDGHDDLVVGSWSAGSVIVLWGIGDGTFQTGVSYAGSSYLGSFSSFAVAVGDLRGTGSPDVLVANSDAVSILLNETPAPDVRVQTYHYDGLQRLRSATAPGIAMLYDYDLAGNRTAVWSNGQLLEHRAYDAANQIVGWEYDATGNLLDDGTATYVYDALNRLTEHAATSYSYNGDGVLVDDGTTQYTQDLASPLTQILQATQGITTTNHLYGLDRLASVVGGTRAWYATDALGSVRQTVNDSGAVLGVISYDPWGNLASGTTTAFGFTGELQDSSGMVYLRARWYNPAQGRFGARDPFQGDLEQPYSQHPYQYGLSDPVRMVDRSGWCTENDFGGLTSSACKQAYEAAMSTIGLDPTRHEALYKRFDISEFAEIYSWGSAGIQLSEGAWDPNSVWSIIKALKRIRAAVGGSQGTTNRMLGLDMDLSFTYNAAKETDPWMNLLFGGGGGGSAAYAKGQNSYAGRVTINPGSGGIADEAVIIHELGHRFDHIAGDSVEYWSSRWAWLNAAGWKVDCLPGPGLTYTLSDTGAAGAVSEYAARNMVGVFGIAAHQYYQNHTAALVQDGWTEADFVNAATAGRDVGNPVEDFAETFAWYVYKESKNLLPYRKCVRIVRRVRVTLVRE